MELTHLKGCGPKTAEHLKAAGIDSLEALIRLHPRRYDLKAIEDTQMSEAAYYHAVVLTKPTIFAFKKNLKRLQFKATVLGESITISLFNQTHWLTHLAPGVEMVIYGVFKRPMTAQKCYLKKSFLEGIMPVYGLKKVADSKLQQFILEAMTHLDLKEDLPPFMVQKYQLAPLKEGLLKRHNPKDIADLEAAEKRDKVTFLFSRQLEQAYLIKNDIKPRYDVDIKTLDGYINKLPFTLTTTQKEVIQELLEGINAPVPMRHLLQGDTGSGKTVVAFLVAMAILEKNKQVALMAPTEILAFQHYQSFKSLFPKTPVVFLTGSLDATTTHNALERLKTQKGTMIIGTHALFSTRTQYHQLGLVIIDEQHRFGVAQRQKLLDKGTAVDFISLSATPIPRTLALTLYHGMDVSTLKEKPKGRQPVTTTLHPLKAAKDLDGMIETTLKNHKQVFIIAPRIEEDDQLLSIERIEKYYRQAFPKAHLKTLHGQHDAGEKEITLQQFASGAVDILIATTVVEVGIDIKGATLMFIYHAERFGLAQLHQLRGRLGRHNDAGECVLIYRGSGEVKRRLEYLKTTDDGFELSQKDLETRGFGTLFGLQQSGFSQMQTWPYEETLALMQSVKDDVVSFFEQSESERLAIPLYQKLFPRSLGEVHAIIKPMR